MLDWWFLLADGDRSLAATGLLAVAEWVDFILPILVVVELELESELFVQIDVEELLLVLINANVSCWSCSLSASKRSFPSPHALALDATISTVLSAICLVLCLLSGATEDGVS